MAGRFLRLLQSFWKDKTVLNLGRAIRMEKYSEGTDLRDIQEVKITTQENSFGYFNKIEDNEVVFPNNSTY